MTPATRPSASCTASPPSTLAPLPTSPTPPWLCSFPRPRWCATHPCPVLRLTSRPPARSHCWRLRLDLFDRGRLREVPDPGSGTAEDIVSEDYDKLL